MANSKFQVGDFLTIKSPTLDNPHRLLTGYVHHIVSTNLKFELRYFCVFPGWKGGSSGRSRYDSIRIPLTKALPAELSRSGRWMNEADLMEPYDDTWV